MHQQFYFNNLKHKIATVIYSIQDFDNKIDQEDKSWEIYKADYTSFCEPINLLIASVEGIINGSFHKPKTNELIKSLEYHLSNLEEQRTKMLDTWTDKFKFIPPTDDEYEEFYDSD